MLHYFNNLQRNTSSNHDFEKQAKQAIYLSRNHISELIPIKTKRIYTNTEDKKHDICLTEYQ
jgi:cysteine sulfinate desulfinase/cysteine desulfurase-like protein